MHTSELYDNFKDLYISNNIDNNVVENDESFIIDEYLDRNISIEELIEAVNKQNNNKSSGIDKLVAEIFKCSFGILAPFLLTLFNMIFNTGVYPLL